MSKDSSECCPALSWAQQLLKAIVNGVRRSGCPTLCEYRTVLGIFQYWELESEYHEVQDKLLGIEDNENDLLQSIRDFHQRHEGLAELMSHYLDDKVDKLEQNAQSVGSAISPQS
jgi:hypothetical protein